jgi:hypothetical protein
VSGVQLALVPEPVALKLMLRALAKQSPGRAAALLVGSDEVAAHLWGRWGHDLEAADMPRGEFLAVLAGYQRELWYWLWGNRTWQQCSQGLAGRLARRASAAP